MEFCRSSFGTYTVNYRFNAGGCFSVTMTPTDGNPHFCSSSVGPGPIFFTGLTPGQYQLEALAIGPAGPTSPSIWLGNAAGGTRVNPPAFNVGDTFAFTLPGSEMSLYF